MFRSTSCPVSSLRLLTLTHNSHFHTTKNHSFRFFSSSSSSSAAAAKIRTKIKNNLESTFRPVYILSAARTPLGSFQGVFRDVDTTHLGAVVVAGALTKGNVLKDAVESLYLGNVLSAGLGQAPVKQVCMEAGLSANVNCTLINKGCCSGLKAVTISANDIILGVSDIVVAGGMESMSRTPYYLPHLRYGAGKGHVEAIDGMIYDGLRDAHSKEDIGILTERFIRKRMEITREEQDNFAARSYTRAAHATFEKKFEMEVLSVPLAGKQPGQSGQIIKEDEEVKRYENIDHLPQMKPIFENELRGDGGGGTLTSGNMSTFSDGAAAVVLASQTAIERGALKPVAKILAYADAEDCSENFPIVPSKAIEKCLQKAGLGIHNIDLFEINETSAAVSVANHRQLDLNHDKVNVFGGAISLGHPLGASGARILVTLLNALTKLDKTIGVAAIGNGGGGATAVVVERVGTSSER